MGVGGRGGVLFAFVVALSWLSAAIGLFARSPESASAVTFFVWFLPDPSSAFVPIVTMPGWIQGFAERQPVRRSESAGTYLASTTAPSAHPERPFPQVDRVAPGPNRTNGTKVVGGVRAGRGDVQPRGMSALGGRVAAAPSRLDTDGPWRILRFGTQRAAMSTSPTR